MSVPTVSNLKERINGKVCDTKMEYTQIVSKKLVIEIGKIITVYHGETSNFQIGPRKLYSHPCANSNNIITYTNYLMFSIKEKNIRTTRCFVIHANLLGFTN